MQSTTVYIGLGSNLADPVHQVTRAFHAMSQITNTRAEQLSPLYRSEAVGPAGQPDYINAAARLQTQLAPIELLEALQAIELQQLRVRNEHWGPRTIDLDILLYGAATIATPRLSVPHRFIKERNFVLAPLRDLEPQLLLPDGTNVTQLLAEIGMAKLCLLN